MAALNMPRTVLFTVYTCQFVVTFPVSLKSQDQWKLQKLIIFPYSPASSCFSEEKSEINMHLFSTLRSVDKRLTSECNTKEAEWKCHSAYRSFLSFYPLSYKETSHILYLNYLECTSPSWHTLALVLKRLIVVGKQVVHPVNYEFPSYLIYLFLIPISHFSDHSQWNASLM